MSVSPPLMAVVGEESGDLISDRECNNVRQIARQMHLIADQAAQALEDLDSTAVLRAVFAKTLFMENTTPQAVFGRTPPSPPLARAAVSPTRDNLYTCTSMTRDEKMHQKFLRPTWNEAQQMPCRITTWASWMVYDMFIFLWVHRWHPVQCAGRTAECWRWVECLPRSSLTFRGFFWLGGSPVRNNRKQVPLTKCTVKICCSIVLLHPIFMLAGWLLLLSLSFESFVSFMFMPFCFPFGYIIYISTSAKPKPLLTIINHLFWN